LPVEIVQFKSSRNQSSSFQPLPQWIASSRELADSAALESLANDNSGVTKSAFEPSKIVIVRKRKGDLLTSKMLGTLNFP